MEALQPVPLVRQEDLLNELFDQLQLHAPAGYYFDSLEEDPTNFGFWPTVATLSDVEPRPQTPEPPAASRSPHSPRAGC